MSSREKDRKKKSQLKPVKKSLPTGKRKRSNDQPSPKSKRAKVKRNRDVRASTALCDSHLTDLVFDVNHGDFNEFLEPLLQGDKELDLFKWMISFNLLKKPTNCMHSGCGSTSLELTAYLQCRDHFVWKCRSCSHNMSIRRGSFFTNVKCSIQLALSVVQAWCYQKSPEVFENIENMKVGDARRIYQVCIDTVNLYMKNPEENTQILGGRNSVVLLDMWPNGFLPAPACERESKRRWGDRLRVLWLSDTNHVPVRYWAKVLPPMKTSSELRMQARNKMDAGKRDRAIAQHCKKNILESENDPHFKKNQNKRHNRRKNTETHLRGCSENKPPQGRALRKVKDMKKEKPTLHQSSKKSKTKRTTPIDFKEQKQQEERERLNEMIKAVVEVAGSHIAPSSLVLASERALPGLCDVLISSGRYEGVMSVEQLLAVNSGGHRPTSSILESIWERGTAVCKELQDATRTIAHIKLVEFLWRQRFDTGGSKTFYYILSHIASHYHPQNSANSKFPTELEF